MRRESGSGTRPRRRSPPLAPRMLEVRKGARQDIALGHHRFPRAPLRCGPRTVTVRAGASLGWRAWTLAAMTCGKGERKNPNAAFLTSPEARSQETRPPLENPRPSRLPAAAQGGDENAHSTPHLARTRIAFRAGT